MRVDIHTASSNESGNQYIDNKKILKVKSYSYGLFIQGLYEFILQILNQTRILLFTRRQFKAI